MIEFRYSGEELWNRMERAVERVNERLRKTVTILENANVPYAVVGGHAVHVVLTGEIVKPDDFDPNPDIEPTTLANNFKTITLEALVRMKLNSHRDKDRVHVRDMISVGLIDESWLARYPNPIRTRLKELLDDPNG